MRPTCSERDLAVASHARTYQRRLPRTLVMTSGVRAFAPTFFTSVYAIGVGEQVLGGYLIWFVLVGCSLILTAIVPWLPKRAEGIITRDDDAD